MPPGAIVVERRLETDPGAMPRFKERVPYVIVNGQAGAVDQSKLKDLVLSPEEFMSRDGLMLNANYYIKKQINPALNRIFFEIFDIDVNNWYDKMPKKSRDLGAQSKRVNYFSVKVNSSKSVVS
jgi:DNA polymerase zeta